MRITIDKPVLKSLLIVTAVVEARDPYTGGHLWRVSQYARLLAERLGLEPERVARISLGGFLHDLGKVGVPDAILRKPGPLDAREFEVIKTHPVVGEGLIEDHPLGILVRDPIRHHHERISGRGYPDGLHEQGISLDARIVAVADVFDALTSTRAYHAGINSGQALQILRQASGEHLDGALVEQFAALGRAGVLDQIVLHSDEGVRLVHCTKCGPVIAVPKDAQDGEIVYCMACGTRHRLHRSADGFVAEDLHGSGGPLDLRPRADVGPIERFVRQMPPALSVAH